MKKNNKTVPFIKMAGTGNDFIVFDNTSGFFSGRETSLFQQICRRRVSIGADGVILMEKGNRAPVRMRYFNRDGREAAMCGNGARCTGYLARHLGFTDAAAFDMEASDGVHKMIVDGDTVTLSLPPPTGYRRDLNIVREPGFKDGAFMDAGVTHFVILVPDADAVDVVGIAPYYRYHEAFPGGTNVNFVQLSGGRRIRVRTFEKGVEEETLSCGTGCVASALSVSKSEGYRSPVSVETQGGDLTVNFDDTWAEITLTGDVKRVYKGEIMLPLV